MGGISSEVPLPMPLGGVSDDNAFSEQRPGTTREAFSVRGEDPTNGRERLSQRSGMTKANDAAVDADVPVREMISTVVDARNLTYSFTDGLETEEWHAASPSKADVLMGVTDDHGDIYVVDGNAGVAKFNPDGTLVWQFPLPVKDPGLSVRFVHVDDIFDVYVGLSFGARQDLGRMWKLTQLPDDEVEIAWEVELEAFVETVKVRQDKLYTLQNEPDVERSYIRIYDSLDAALPKLVQEIRVAHPANDFDVNDAGDIAVASDQGSHGITSSLTRALALERGPNPRFPRFAPEAEDWTPFDLDNFAKRIWSWYVADDVTEFDVIGSLVQDAEVRRWPDRSGHKRHLYAATSIGKKAPTIAIEGLGSHKVIRFNGVDQALISRPNASVKKQNADQQRTALPAYEGSMFCTILVCRPEKRDTGSPMWIFGQDNSAAGALDHIVIANRTDGAALGVFASGLINHYAATDGTGDGGQGTNGHPLEASFDNFNDFAIIVILWDGGIDPNDTTVTRSLFQLNGKPIDRYEGLGNTTKEPTIVGFWTNPSAGFTPFEGDLVEWITLDRINREDDTTEPKVLTHDHLETGSANVDQTANELTKLVGYLAHKYGLQHLLPNDSAAFTHPYGAMNRSIDTFNILDTFAGPPTGAELGPHAITQRMFPMLAKYNAQGELLWALNGETSDSLLSPGDQVSGVGHGVRFDKDGNLMSMGPPSGFFPDPSSNFLRKIIDQGDDFSIDPIDGAWGVDIGDPGYAFPRMVTDKFGNVYVPVFDTVDGLRVFKGSDGTQISGVTLNVPGRPAYAVAIDPKIPDYGEDLVDPLARFAYAFGQAGTDPELGIFKIRLVQESPVTGSPRQHVNLAISGAGVIRRFEIGGSMTAPAGASGLLSSTPAYIQACALFEKIVISDGISPLVVYDPRTDTCSVLTSSKSGEPPHGAKILEAWAGRLVGLRAPNLISGAYNWLMSAKGDITDFDAFPVTRSPASAIGGSNSVGPGLVPDLPTGFVPYDDDIAFVGCDHAIYLLTGDPGDGGQFDLVSDITGMAFGRAWCKDPDGNVWFLGSRGGLFVMAPGGRPKRVSLNSIEARLRAINFGTHYTRLVWNDDDQGIHIFRFPFGTPGAPVEHWFWDSKRGAAWPDTFGTSLDPSVEPTAAYVVDGDDPEDRLLLLGGRDGFIRKWDSSAKDDDGVAIDANVMIGPLVGAGSSREYRFVGPRIVLATEQDGALYELFSTDDPANPGAARYSGELAPGRNPMKRTRMRGSYCLVRLRNSLPGQRFSVEEAGIRATPAGLKRVRETL